MLLHIIIQVHFYFRLVYYMSQLHNITQLMSYVHGPNDRFKNKGSRCWNPSASVWIRSEGKWTQLINWVMLCWYFPASAENNTKFKKLIHSSAIGAFKMTQNVSWKWTNWVCWTIECKEKIDLSLSTYSCNCMSWDRHWERQFSNAVVQSHVLQFSSLEHSNFCFCKPLITIFVNLRRSLVSN